MSRHPKLSSKVWSLVHKGGTPDLFFLKYKLIVQLKRALAEQSLSNYIPS